MLCLRVGETLSAKRYVPRRRVLPSVRPVGPTLTISVKIQVMRTTTLLEGSQDIPEDSVNTTEANGEKSIAEGLSGDV